MQNDTAGFEAVAATATSRINTSIVERFHNWGYTSVHGLLFPTKLTITGVACRNWDKHHYFITMFAHKAPNGLRYPLVGILS
jgi:hypothetical protein